VTWVAALSPLKLGVIVVVRAFSGIGRAVEAFRVGIVDPFVAGLPLKRIILRRERPVAGAYSILVRLHGCVIPGVVQI
jgi:hypothetical protein